jgi:hypothetical protein
VNLRAVTEHPVRIGNEAARSGGAGHASVISSSAITQLEALASNWASVNDDPSPSSALAVLTTAGEAETAITGDKPSAPDDPGLNDPAYLISMTGNFTLNGVPTPTGAAPVIGTDMDIVFDASTFRILEMSLKPTATTDVSALGTPAKLTW